MRDALEICFREIFGWKIPNFTKLADIKDEFSKPDIAIKVAAYIFKYAPYKDMETTYARLDDVHTIAFKKTEAPIRDNLISLEKKFNLLLIIAATIRSEGAFFEVYENLLNEVYSFKLESEYDRKYCVASVFNAMQNLYKLFVEEEFISCEAKLEFLTSSEFFQKQERKTFLNVVLATIRYGILHQSFPAETAVTYLDKLVLPLIQKEISSRYDSILLPKIRKKPFDSRKKFIEDDKWAVQFLQFCSENRERLPQKWFPILSALYHHLVDTIIPKNQEEFHKFKLIRSGRTYDYFYFDSGWREWQQRTGEIIASPEVIRVVIYLLMLFPEENLPKVLFNPEIAFDIPNYAAYVNHPLFPSFLNRVLEAIEAGTELKTETCTTLAGYLSGMVNLSSYPLTLNAALAIVKLLTPHGDYIEKAQSLLEHCSEVIFGAYFRMCVSTPYEAIKLEWMLEQVYPIHRAILENNLKRVGEKHADFSSQLVSAIKLRKPVSDGDFEQLAEFNALQTECKEAYDLLAKYVHLQIYLSVNERNILDSDLCQTDPNIKVWAQRYTRVLALKAPLTTQTTEPSMAQAIMRFSGIHTRTPQVPASAVESFKQESRLSLV